MFIEDNIEFKAKFGDGSEPKKGFFGSKLCYVELWYAISVHATISIMKV
jgi:hypothetical protein